MSLGYSNPGWINGSGAAINATNLNAISNALQVIGAAFDIGGDPAYLYGGASALGSGIATFLAGNADTSNLVLENRTSDPVAPALGRIWLRTDL